MDRVRAPYGFVPLNPQVVFPEWSAAATRDHPFEDGISGTFSLTVTARSPLCVRGKEKDKVSLPFQFPDDTYGIPGSSVRGLIRNVVEIATFGKLARVNRHRYALRDLHNQRSYVRHMARIENRQPVPLVNAGWLVPSDDPAHPATLHPCHFAKLEYATLVDIAEQAFQKKGFRPGRKQSAVEKYAELLSLAPTKVEGEQPSSDAANKNGKERWERPEGWQRRRLAAVKLTISPIPRTGPEIRSKYGKVTGPGPERCRVVMTGQPSPYEPGRPKQAGAGNPKHHDFVFHGQAGAPIQVGTEAFEDFEFAHSDRGQQNSLGKSVDPNREWGFWRSLTFEHPDRAWVREDPQRGVPVFFLLNPDGSLRAMGLAMMFRLSSRRSVTQAIEAHQPTVKDVRLDFAQTLFGHVPDSRRGEASTDPTLGGRVTFGHARAQGNPTPGKVVQVVLGTPKASYYPNYLEQGTAPGQSPPRDERGKPVWTTWMEDTATPRGWKRYRPIEGHQIIRPPPPKKGDGTTIDLDTSKVATRFAPLPERTTFDLTVHLHNVRPVELGALLWAFDHGGTPDTFHKLGLGRPLGYGTITLTPRATDFEQANGVRVTADACRAAFRTWMDDAWRRLGGEGRWEDSGPIRELIALAKPQPVDAARHMQIDHPQNQNEFHQAKKDGQVLAAASTGGRFLPRTPPAAGAGRSGPGRPSGPAPQPAAAAATGAAPLPRAGERVSVTLTGQNRNGCWQARGAAGSGTFVRGTPPTGAAVGAVVEGRVVRASSRLNLELEW